MHHLIAYKIVYLTIYFVFKRKFTNFSYYTGTFLVGTYWFRIPFPNLQTFSRIFWVLAIDCCQYEKMILGTFAYLFICDVTTRNVNCRFYKQCIHAATRLFRKRAIFAQNANVFLALTFPYTLKRSVGKIMQGSGDDT